MKLMIIHRSFVVFSLLMRVVFSQVSPETHRLCGNGDDDKGEEGNENDKNTCSSGTMTRTRLPQIHNVPPDCSLVMAKSFLDGFGIFTLLDRRRGSPVLPGDVVIQVPDVMNTVGVQFFKDNYWKSAHETGGMNEGHIVHSVMPGVSMLTNSVRGNSNILPYRVDRDDGDCPRETCHAMGSFTHYHNYTWYFHKDVQAGQELLSPQTEEWFQERSLWDDDDNDNVEPPRRSQEWLRQHGTCLDNMIPKSSSISGRGAFASRLLPKGSIVAPVPVLPIFEWQISLNLIKIQKSKESDGLKQQWQLLLSYCYGHPQSSMLLFPYSPIVNLVNHHGDEANVKLQWSTKNNNNQWLKWSISDLEDHADEPGLALELVALRDILPGDEIVMDYGSDWSAAWEAHVQAMTVLHGGQPQKQEQKIASKQRQVLLYTPAHVMDEVASKLRTSTEQMDYPYPSNLQTSCFYEYPNPTTTTTTSENGITSDAHRHTTDSGITTIPWNRTRGVFDWVNLHPCTILKRDETSSFYTVQIMRHGMSKAANSGNADRSEKKKSYHIVSKVPRLAIRFTDKMYTTDQHLSGAFRHWIGIPDDIFPQAWRDEKDASDSRH